MARWCIKRYTRRLAHEGTLLRGLASQASVPRFRRIHAGDQGPHCRPLDPASLSLLPGGSVGRARSGTVLEFSPAATLALTLAPNVGVGKLFLTQGDCS
jgi:hypothetical protein